MLFINIKTNAEVSEEKANKIKTHLGLAITAIPGKSEGWLMVGIEDNYQLFFKGTDEPAAMVEVSLYGNASSNALGVLTSNITRILLDILGISTDRIYVSYMSTENWGWNGSNF
ncbi:phenylpyruvate tautomerase MIF-related protein [uncultured Ruminococcus sp.]|uniref:phenylpyruvate tautomerase MIF-related protein n=1 Tax=uncultured Ruminococcus sp. TaxID=165186 RepID=UPI002942F895|nr:phenylpyruvate tautomerase MIF-related protein [uncultured Ruminococcus sp.]